MKTVTWLSWACTAAGIGGIYLAGKKDWRGWALGLAVQPLWLLLAIAVKAWPLILSAVAYAYVDAINLVRWRRQPETVQPGDPVFFDFSDEGLVVSDLERIGACCTARQPTERVPFYCTLDEGHPGDHVGQGADGRVLARWARR